YTIKLALINAFGNSHGDLMAKWSTQNEYSSEQTQLRRIADPVAMETERHSLRQLDRRNRRRREVGGIENYEVAAVPACIVHVHQYIPPVPGGTACGWNKTPFARHPPSTELMLHRRARLEIELHQAFVLIRDIGDIGGGIAVTVALAGKPIVDAR